MHLINMSQKAEQTSLFDIQITSLQIAPTHPSKTQPKYSLHFKIDQTTAVIKDLFQSIIMTVPITQSKSQNRYQPVKIVIRIYERSQNGLQLIVGVGGIQIDQYINRCEWDIVIQKQIGPVQVKLKLQLKKVNTHSQNFAARQHHSQKSIQKKRQNNKTSASLRTTSTSKKKFQRQRNQQSALSSNPKISISSYNSKQISNQMDVPQYCLIREQLLIQKHKNQINQQKRINLQLKCDFLQRKCNNILAQNDSLKKNIKDIVKSLDLKQLYQIKANISDKTITLFCQDKKSKSLLQNLQVLIRKIQQTDEKQTKTELNEFSISKNFFQRIDQFEKQKIILMEKLKIKDQSIFQLNKQLSIKNECPSNQERRLAKQRQKIANLQNKIRDLENQKFDLQDKLQFFKRKYDYCQSLVQNKDSTIEHLGKLLSNQNKEISILKENKQQAEKNHKNSQLRVGQLQQQVQNLSQTIEKYIKKYGNDLKSSKKTLQKEIKECLMWIDSQSRETQDFEDNTFQSESPHHDSISSVMSNIQIENLPQQQMEGIHKQLTQILLKIQNFMKSKEKNSLRFVF